MRSTPALLPLVLLFTLPKLSAGGGDQEAHFVHFTAKDQNEVYLRDLRIDEVRLWLDELPVELAYLGYRNVDTAFVFLIENSPRTAPHAVSLPRRGQVNAVDQLRYALGDDFLRPLVQQGPVLLAEFYQEIEILQDFTQDDYSLEIGLLKLKPNSLVADTENIAVGRSLARAVDWMGSRTERRRIVVLVTASVDRDSYKHLEEYQQMLSRSGVELYVVSFAPKAPSGGSFSFNEKMNRYFFNNLTRATSGKTYISGDYVYLSTLLLDLKARLSNHYTVGFYVEPEPEVKEHALEIKVRRDRVKVFHRRNLLY
jgi:hypothetical protein